MPKILRLATSQSRTLTTLAQTLRALESTTFHAASQGVDLILFPEAYLGGYPRTCSFGAAVGSRNAEGHEQFLRYFQSAVDLGDTPEGADEAWLERRLAVAKGAKFRGDGIREELERIARETGVFIVTGVVERSGGSLYCAVVFVDPVEGVLGKRRKVMPTGTERVVWAQGSPRTLRAVVATIKGVRLVLGSAICWENYMPLLRQSLYAQNVSLFLAPTADARETWAPLMQTVGAEGRCFVLSANQCQKRKHLPDWITGVKNVEKPPASTSSFPIEMTNGSRRRSSVVLKTEDGHEINLPVPPTDTKTSAVVEEDPSDEDSISKNQSIANVASAVSATSASEDEEFVSRGGSCIVSPNGLLLQGPLWDVEDGGILTVDADFEDCERGRLDLDVAGSYSRNDSFRLSVVGLDMDPPP